MGSLLSAGLDSKVDEHNKFSTGQKQLLCFGRALLRGARIVLLDEATASVDPENDRLIQQVIDKELSGCTLIIIAHRLRTVIQSDRIMVLGKGELKEFGEPHSLLENVESELSALVSETGPAEAQNLRDLALQKHNRDPIEYIQKETPQCTKNEDAKESEAVREAGDMATTARP
eukprot:SAG31_NODE_5522_length_2481_cov_1.638959_2_plen_174_part_00